MRGLGNQRTIETAHPNGLRVVSYGSHRGFTERPVVGKPGYVSRTFVNGQSSQVAIYRMYSYQHHSYYRYVPSVYYRPAFYAWMIAPWGVAINFDWGHPVWGAYYGAYFTPYPAYPSADLWLTDYVLNANLQQAYAEQQPANAYPPGYPTETPSSVNPPGYSTETPSNANPPGYSTEAPANLPPIPNQAEPYSPPAPAVGYPTSSEPEDQKLSPEVKELISEQIHADIARLQTVSADVSTQNASGDSEPSEATIPESLSPGTKAFEVSTDMQLDINDDQSCALTPGDVLFRETSTPDADGNVQVVVVGRKHGDCEKNTTAKLSVATLEEMNNQFELQLQTGMGILAAKGGKGPIPAPPVTATTRLQLASAQQLDPNAASELQQNQAAGQQAVTELGSATSGGNQ